MPTPFADVPDDFVLPVSTAARLLKINEEDIYAGVIGGHYVLLAPNDRWWDLNVFHDHDGEIVTGPPPEILRASGHWLLSGITNPFRVSPPWRDVGRRDLLQWLADGTIPKDFALYDDGSNGSPPVYFSLDDLKSDTSPIKPPFLGMLGALFNRIQREGFPPKGGSLDLERELPMPRHSRGIETMRVITETLLEMAECKSLAASPTEAAVRTSRLYEEIRSRMGEVAPKTVANHLSKLLGRT